MICFLSLYSKKQFRFEICLGCRTCSEMLFQQFPKRWHSCSPMPISYEFAGEGAAPKDCKKHSLCDVQTYLEFEVVRKNVPVARRKRCSKCPRKRQDSWQLRDCLFRRHGERSSQRCTTKCSTGSFAHSVFSYGSI